MKNRLIEKEQESKRLPIKGKVRKGFILYCVLILVFSLPIAAFATEGGNPIDVVNNLSDFIFGFIRAIGLIILGFGVVQIGLAFKSNDPTQKANGMLTVGGGIVIVFVKEILNLITGG